MSNFFVNNNLQLKKDFFYPRDEDDQNEIYIKEQPAYIISGETNLQCFFTNRAAWTGSYQGNTGNILQVSKKSGY